VLTPDEAEQVALVLRMAGWNNVMRPRLEARIKKASRALTLEPSERGQEFKGTEFDAEDHVLRVIIRQCEWMVFSWHNEVQVAAHNQRRDELDRQVTQ